MQQCASTDSIGAAYYAYPMEQSVWNPLAFQVIDLDDDEPPTETPRDLTGYTFKGSIRETFEAPVSFEFDFEETDLSVGLFTILLSLENQALLNSRKSYVYDVFMIDPDGHPTRLVYGPLDFQPRVTHVED